MSLVSNLKKRGLKDILNPKKWKIFARYMKIKLLKQEYSEMFVPEYLEQVSLRMSEPGCRPCLEKGECVHCGCKSPDLFFEKDMECSGGNWLGMLPPEMWREQRQYYNINKDYVDQIKKHGKIINF